MIQPEELKKSEPLKWSAGTGTDVWELFCACIAGDLATVSRLLTNDPSLVRCHHAYRTPLYFAVRENRLAVAEFLLEHGADPIGLAVNDSLLDICRDRGYAEMEKLLEVQARQRSTASRPGARRSPRAIRERDLARSARPARRLARTAARRRPAFQSADPLGRDDPAARSDRRAPRPRRRHQRRAPATAHARFSSPTATTTIAAGATCRRTSPRHPARCSTHLRARGAYCRHLHRRVASATWNGSVNCWIKIPHWPTASRSTSRTTSVPGPR